MAKISKSSCSICLLLFVFAGCDSVSENDSTTEASAMILQLEDGSSFKNPDRETIATALARVGEAENGFAILGRTDMTYIQVSGDPSSGFVIEFQTGSLDEHYGTTADKIPLADVVSSFQEYATDSDRWKSRFKWERVTLE